MSYQQDWLMRQIEAITAALIYLLFEQKQHAANIAVAQQTTSELNSLYRSLRNLTDQGKVCAAENLLFEAMDRNHPEAMEAGIRFYADLNRFSDSALEACDFSREEVSSGLQELCKRYDINLFTK